ncbi:MAG: hypothetical protein CL602_17080 [Alteromonas sp.]|uniref:Uncharacterized protein n=1 Tax=Alteromonas australica TaxID=589873 RepID=A0A358DZU8_9ALTE|nr:hypothetical protein [Alteromonas australica]MBU32554.1 hypothetical protein [Alteromonas sp.]MBU35586.1 hypothetical protein [Alteromonas sp.]HBU51452.1 hypothetical protein [Alteromonas australica]|tara:strand:- start:12556 stop:12846 length:291 start_codon:yes stop_codon:yes gene_type:complete
MKAKFLHADPDVTPLNEAQKNACVEMLDSFNATSPALRPTIHIHETLQGHIAIIMRDKHVPCVGDRVYPAQFHVAARHNLRWLSADGEKVSFGLPQ